MTNTEPFDKYFTHSEENTLFKVIADSKDILSRRDHAWMSLLKKTGIRVETLAGLTVGDAKKALKSETLILRAKILKGRKKTKLVNSKLVKGKDHPLPVTDDVRKALTTLLSLRIEMGAKNQDQDEALILSRRGSMSIRSFQDRCNYWGKKAGIRKCTPHMFRHTVGKRIAENSTAKNPMRIAQAVLAHVSPASTSIYTEPDFEQVAEEMEATL